MTKLCAIKLHVRERCERLCVTKLWCVTRSYLREMDSLAAWMSPSATPATQNEGPCRQVPRLPRKVLRRHRRPAAPKRRSQTSAVSVAKCHTCHAKCHGEPSAVSATPATQNEGRCREVPRMPCKVKVDVAKCHPGHTKSSGAQARHQSQPSAVSATPATQNADRCRPRYQRRPSSAQARQPSQPSAVVPRLPRKNAG